MNWRDVIGFEGLYQVSDKGQVRNARTHLVLKPRPDADGYLLVSLWSGSPTKKHDKKVHRLVLEAFVGPAPAGKPECDHRNRVRDDNQLGNLRWASVSTNRRNVTPRSASGSLGVRYSAEKANPWHAYATISGSQRSLGHFPTQQQAIAARAAYDKGAQHG